MKELGLGLRLPWSTLVLLLPREDFDDADCELVTASLRAKEVVEEPEQGVIDTCAVLLLT